MQVPDARELIPRRCCPHTARESRGPPLDRAGEERQQNLLAGGSAPADRIRADLEAERSTEAYAKRRAATTVRREKKQSEYVEDYRGAVLKFLDFAPECCALAEQLADAVTQHATPVGRGTVART